MNETTRLTRETAQNALRYDFDRLFQAIYRYVRVRITSNEEAEDVASDVLCQAWRKAHLYNPADGDVLPWLIGIAKNQLKMRWRKKQIAVSDWELVENLASDDGRSVSELYDVLDLSRLMAHLHPDHRALVLLHYVDGFSYADIATAHGGTAEAIRQTASRALRQLRGLIPKTPSL